MQQVRAFDGSVAQEVFKPQFTCLDRHTISIFQEVWRAMKADIFRSVEASFK